MLKKSITLILFLLLLMTPSLTVFAENELHITNNEKDISIDEAKNVVINDIASLTPEHEFYGLWNQVDVVFSAELYDITDAVVGYYFKLINSKGINVGYYLTGAKTNITPILEYSASPHEAFENRDKLSKIYYFSGKNYTFANDTDTIINQLNEKLLTSRSNQSTINEQDMIDQLTFNRNADAPLLWNQYLESNNIVGLASYPSTGWLDVPRIFQRQPGVENPKSACGPTSLAMAVQYLSSLGYNVHDVSHFNYSMSEMINGYYNFLGSNIFGTSSGNMSYLVPQLLNMYMSGWTATSVNADSSGAIDKFKDRVISSRPPLVMWDTLWWFPWVDADVDWHWQTGNAYRTSGGVFQFGVKNPDNGPENTSTTYYSWVDNDDGFMFVSYKQN